MIHFDVKTAFLNSKLKETVYMNQPFEYTQPGSETKVCLLNKALYGLKQAGRAWYDEIDADLIVVGMNMTLSDGNVYFSFHNQ